MRGSPLSLYRKFLQIWFQEESESPGAIRFKRKDPTFPTTKSDQSSVQVRDEKRPKIHEDRNRAKSDSITSEDRLSPEQYYR